MAKCWDVRTRYGATGRASPSDIRRPPAPCGLVGAAAIPASLLLPSHDIHVPARFHLNLPGICIAAQRCRAHAPEGDRAGQGPTTAAAAAQ